MQDSFGARLRQRREEQQIALTTIAEQTKIKLSLLEALERDDVSHWPAGIFRRAFIRAYAHAIGLNPDEVVREFVDVHPEPGDLLAAAAAVAASADGDRAQSGPPTRLRSIVGSAIDSLSRLRRGAAPEDAPVLHAPRVEAAAAAHEHQEDPEFEAVFSPPSPAAEAPAAASAPEQPKPELEPEPERAVEQEPEAAVISAWTPLRHAAAAEPDLQAVANLCTDFGRVDSAAEVQPLLARAAGILDAAGLIVWIWDAAAEGLRPALVHGYSDRVLAQLPTVRRDADNPTAAAFRSAEACAIDGHDHTSGALVLPLLAPGGCAGVLAIELQQGRELSTGVRAVATILAALLAQLVGGPRPAEAQADTAPSGTDLDPAGPSYAPAVLTR